MKVPSWARSETVQSTVTPLGLLESSTVECLCNVELTVQLWITALDTLPSVRGTSLCFMFFLKKQAQLTQLVLVKFSKLWSCFLFSDVLRILQMLQLIPLFWAGCCICQVKTVVVQSPEQPVVNDEELLFPLYLQITKM